MTVMAAGCLLLHVPNKAALNKDDFLLCDTQEWKRRGEGGGGVLSFVAGKGKWRQVEMMYGSFRAIFPLL